MALLLLFATLLCLTNVFAVPTVKDDVAKEDYRLSQVFKVNKYTLDLNVPEKSFTSESDKYSGTVKIEFIFTDATTEYITLHAHPDYITITRLNFNNLDLEDADYSIDKVTQILKVKVVNTVTANRAYTLTIDYDGRLSTDNMYGFYKSNYVDTNNETKYLATTQFEPTHARKAFPCFDEPNFKAKFDVSITYPTGLSVLFNTNVKSTADDKDTR